MGHRGHREGVPPAIRRTLTVAAAFLAMVTIVWMVLLRPSGDRREQARAALRQAGVVERTVRGTVTRVAEGPCAGTAASENIRCRAARIRIDEGPDRGAQTRIEFPLIASSPALEEGDRVVLGRSPGAQPGFEYRFVDRERRGVLIALAVAFALAVVLLGRLRGAAALVGLLASLLVLLTFVLPAIIEGRDPLLVSVFGAAAIAFLALYLAHGFTVMTTVALLGTLASLALTAVLAKVFVAVAAITGFASEEATLVNIGAAQIDLAGLVLGGIVIGALGAIDDMTVTQASAVWELRAANPRMPIRELLRAGLRIGRDHVASTVNTLALAYAGASMPLLVLFVLSDQSFLQVANGEVVATEILRTLVGSIGLVASVPITSWLAVHTVPAERGGRVRG
ncbi:MAG TPA: YibE/F family protein [Actinomycetota bacterium]|nr:YibE/F family protein [Actinomycetota bacterium]